MGSYRRGMDDRVTWTDATWTDAELAELALAVDPDDVQIDDDAVPFGAGSSGADLLPSWYMPVPMASGGAHRRRRAWIVGCLVASMVVVNAVGLCVTSGMPQVGDRIIRFW